MALRAWPVGAWPGRAWQRFAGPGVAPQARKTGSLPSGEPVFSFSCGLLQFDGFWERLRRLREGFARFLQRCDLAGEGLPTQDRDIRVKPIQLRWPGHA